MISLSPGTGKNTIRNNAGCEIKADYGSPTVSIGNPSQGGQNAMYDNTGGTEVYNYSGNPTLWAQYCWWGANGPQTSGTVQSGYYLTIQPSWVGTTGGRLGKSLDPESALASGDSTLDSKEKIKELKAAIEKNPNTKEAEDGLAELYGIIRSDYVENKLQEKFGFGTYLEKLYKNHKARRLGKVALQKLIVWDMLEDQSQKAIALSIDGLKLLTAEDRMCVLEDLAMLYILTGEIEKAKQCLQECKDKYSFDEITIGFIEQALSEAELEIKEGIRKQEEGNDELTRSSTSKPEFFELTQNYPNPGNPTTTIHFQLQESREVVLRITNIMGQEVKTLVNEYREAGTYTIIWDGKNNHGTEVPSGVYLYTLQTGDRVLTKKLMLLK